MKKITEAMCKSVAYVIRADFIEAITSGYFKGNEDDTTTQEYYFLRDGTYSREQLIMFYLDEETKVLELKKKLRALENLSGVWQVENNH